MTIASPGSRPTMNETMQSSHADVPVITQSPQSILSGSRFAMGPACRPGETLVLVGLVLAGIPGSRTSPSRAEELGQGVGAHDHCALRGGVLSHPGIRGRNHHGHPAGPVL